MKKSLEAATKQAIEMSKEHPENIYTVMDKMRKRAVVISCEWVYRELVLEGWSMVKRYKNGEEYKGRV